jgi:hypothetical protein
LEGTISDDVMHGRMGFLLISGVIKMAYLCFFLFARDLVKEKNGSRTGRVFLWNGNRSEGRSLGVGLLIGES